MYQNYRITFTVQAVQTVTLHNVGIESGRSGIVNFFNEDGNVLMLPTSSIVAIEAVPPPAVAPQTEEAGE